MRRRLCEAGLYSRITVEEAKQCQKALVGQGAQRLDNRGVGIKSFGLTNQSSKNYGQTEGSICGEELVKELHPTPYHINRKAWTRFCYVFRGGGFC